MTKIQFTQEGFDKLKGEYTELKTSKREYAVNRLQTARNMGDLSENSEYSAAKEDLAFVEGRIRELEELMKHAQIVSGNHTTNGHAEIGETVIVEYNGKRDEFQLVGEFEANPLEKKLSSTSPIGKALLGKRVGDEIEISVPAGKILYKVIGIKEN